MAEVIDESIRNMTSNMVTKLEVAENRRYIPDRLVTHYGDDLGTISLLDTSAQSHPPQHTTPRSPVVNAPTPSSSASTPVSVPPPAAHIPTSPQSGFGGPSPTSALHPSNQLAGLDSMFNLNAVIQSGQQQQQAQVVGSHSLPAQPVSVQVPRQTVSTNADRMAVAMSSIGSGHLRGVAHVLTSDDLLVW
ncbi:hypothetical protein BGW80DRAFT_1567371 [Lactifluus volemus]|nr:hypothetical protein BGW80DRAFT_1567371 [Lactifluus volemus]